MDNMDRDLDYEITEQEEAQKDKYLSFVIEDEEFAIEIKYVIEIIGMQEITLIPEMPGFVKGVINVRGSVIPVVDVRSRFQMEEMAYHDRTTIIIVRIEDNDIGLIVDAVAEVLDIKPELIDNTTQTHNTTSSRFIQGIGKLEDSIKIILDVKKILTMDEYDKLNYYAE